jgi:hypothetical protein
MNSLFDIHVIIKIYTFMEGGIMLSLYKLEKTIIITIVVGFIMILFTGCAPSVPEAPSHKDSIAKSFKKDKRYANVYLCRNTFMGSAENIPVFVDGKLAGETSAYSFFYWKMKPGKHIIQSKASSNTPTLTLNAKVNTNYFIMQQPKFASWEMGIVDESKGQKCVVATKMLKSKLHMSSYEQKTIIVEPTYVSPKMYENYTCKQINEKIEQISQRSYALSGELKETDASNRSMMSIGPIFFLAAAVSSAATEDEKTELSKLKGEYNALKTVAKRKKCKFASKL